MRPKSSILRAIPESTARSLPIGVDVVPGTVILQMSWVDTHCHLQLDGRSPDDLLERAPEVSWLVAPGVDAASSKASLALAEQFGGRVLATAGLHPHEASLWPVQRADIESLATRVSAIGETGLDFYRDLSPRAAQEDSLRDHIEIAMDLGKPLIVHCRDAFADVHRVISDTGVGPQTVLHCWTGGRRWARRFLDLGVTFSFAGPIAFETGDTIRRSAELIPPERALVETDTPYLAPPPHRGEPNEPAWVALVGEALARVWGLDSEHVARVTAENAAGVFGR